jgi:hypothetical protein
MLAAQGGRRAACPEQSGHGHDQAAKADMMQCAVRHFFPLCRASGAWRAISQVALNSGLLLPGALLVTIGAELLAPFMFVNLGFSSFF